MPGTSTCRTVVVCLFACYFLAAVGMACFAADANKLDDESSKPHIVLVIGEREYETKETLPAFAKKYLDADCRCTFLFATADKGPGRHNVPGLQALGDADLLVLSLRRRALPPDQMQHVRKYLDSGKPLVGIRTSIVSFQLKEKDSYPSGHRTWNDFDREVLGIHYDGYDSRSEKTGCDVWPVPQAKKHPIVANLKSPSFHSHCWLYRITPVSDSCRVLMMGRWRQGEPEYPVAWTNSYKGGRIFFTTLGHRQDFESEPFSQLLLFGIRWALADSQGEAR